ncbi:MAG: hypothetical protein SGILL_005084 [Bacillariaceae sp.]
MIVHVIASVLRKLIEYVQINPKIVLNVGQRQALLATWGTLARYIATDIAGDRAAPTPHISTNRKETQQQATEELLPMRVEASVDHNNLLKIDQDKIVRQISILKKGGYWKFLLPEEEVRDGDGESVFALHQSRSLDEDETEEEGGENKTLPNKENMRCLDNRQNHIHDDADTYDDYANNEAQHDDSSSSNDIHNRTDPAIENNDFQGCILPSPRCDTFWVKKVTDDGWLCTRSLQQQGDHEDKDCHLLRLPSKVSRLGCDGMMISGIALMHRRDNGALEPCSPPEPQGWAQFGSEYTENNL